jgi:hypothetical protein
MTGEDFEAFARRLGSTVETITGDDRKAYSVIRDFTIPNGALRGRRCDIAIERVTTNPYCPPAAIHTRPRLVPFDANEPLRTMASGIGPDWLYWSRRFDKPPTPRGLWTHILTILCDERWPIS